MKLLGLDTSTARLSIALEENRQRIHSQNVFLTKRHAEAILPEIESALAAVGWTPKQLDGVAVGLGPGMFTGLRVGIATAQGLSQALDIPMAGVSSFFAAAVGSGAPSVLVIDDAHQDLLYAALYTQSHAGWQSVQAEHLVSLRQLAEKLRPFPPWPSPGPEPNGFIPNWPSRALRP